MPFVISDSHFTPSDIKVRSVPF